MLSTAGNDRDSGTEELQLAVDDIIAIRDQLQGLSDSAQCAAVAPVFCEVWKHGETLTNNQTDIQTEIDSLTTGDFAERFDEVASYMKFLNVLPWTLVLSAKDHYHRHRQSFIAEHGSCIVYTVPNT